MDEAVELLKRARYLILEDDYPNAHAELVAFLAKVAE